MIKNMMNEDSEVLSIYYGSDVTKDKANLLLDLVKSKYPSCDVDLQYGGQPIYYFIVSVE